LLRKKVIESPFTTPYTNKMMKFPVLFNI